MTVNQWESISSKNQSRHNKGAHNRTDSIGSKVEILSRLREQMIGKEICTELWYFTVAQSANGKQYKWVTNVADQKKSCQRRAAPPTLYKYDFCRVCLWFWIFLYWHSFFPRLFCFGSCPSMYVFAYFIWLGGKAVYGYSWKNLYQFLNSNRLSCIYESRKKNFRSQTQTISMHTHEH